ncbi:MAG: fumarylacetoacetase [Chthonomonas sp.]|nr:fumarylacetoacetase [Chthonomonas sp.]
MKKFVIPANARSWVPGANASDFPIQNLPYCCVDEEGSSISVRIGDSIVILSELQEAGLIDENLPVWDGTEFAFEAPESRYELRKTLFDLLSQDGDPALKDNMALRERALVPVSEVTLYVPFFSRQFVDYYSGIHHAGNVGKMFRPDMPPLLPNYRHIPVAYNGRASSVVEDGIAIVRPNGQTKGANDELPAYGPTQELDFELEMGFYTAGGSDMGMPFPISEAEAHILGVVLLNDWSARDVQRWEYQPLGPFLAKSFATTVSPYVVSLDAIDPFRVAGIEQDPAVLPYLNDPEPRCYDIELEVMLKTPAMAEAQVICRSNAKHLYWSFRQQLAHQVSNGTPIEPCDLYGTGTISGPDEGTFGSLLELTWRGSKPISLTSGEERTFLEDGDTLTIRGWCQGDGYRIGFGEASGTILPAPPI